MKINTKKTVEKNARWIKNRIEAKRSAENSADLPMKRRDSHEQAANVRLKF